VLRVVLILVKPVPEALEIFAPREHRRANRFVEPLQHFFRLLRQRVLLGGGQVPTLVVTVGQVVDGCENAEHDEDARDREGAEARLPSRELANDFAPLAEHVE
jgi:hypothetical protein